MNEQSSSDNALKYLSKLQISPSSSEKKKKQQQIQSYKLGEKLGKGAYSTVYKGLNVETGTFVAIKRIKRKKIAEDLLMTEIKMLKTFKHEHIVRYIDVVISDSHINLVLEYIESGSLASVVEKFGVFPEQLVAIYMEQVLQGLHYLHSHNIIHRDIKGPNILITKEGIVKLAGFFFFIK
jgi:serine/threonine protein kinase